MNGAELLLGGLGALLVGSVLVRSWSGSRGVEVVQLRTRALATVGRTLVLALVIVGVQWLTVTHSDNRLVILGVLGVPALVVSFVLVKAFTVTEARRPRGRDRR